MKGRQMLISDAIQGPAQIGRHQVATAAPRLNDLKSPRSCPCPFTPHSTTWSYNYTMGVMHLHKLVAKNAKVFKYVSILASDDYNADRL
jgi:hypothetical protein